MWRGVFVIGCLALSLSVAQAAHLRSKFKVGSWSGGAYFDDQKKTLDRCTATRPSLEGGDISYSVDREFQWSVTLSNPAWNFIKGARQSVILTVGQPPASMNAHAIAIDRAILKLQVADPMALFAKLRIAQKIRIIIGGLVLDLPLEGGEEVLSALTQCALRATHSYQSVKPSLSVFDSRQAPSKATRAEAAALVSNIIAYAHVENSQALPTMMDLSGLPVDAGWKVGLVTAGVTILESPLPQERIVEDLIARSRRACRGGFFFVTLSDKVNDSPAGRVYDSCQTSETTNSSYHLVITRPKTGAYVLSLLSTGSSFFGAAHRLADQYEARLRSVVMLAIDQLQTRR
jgi:hypothetical protein